MTQAGAEILRSRFPDRVETEDLANLVFEAMTKAGPTQSRRRGGLRNLPEPCSVSELREIINYDGNTGAFTWKGDRGRARNGSVAGTIRITGRHAIRVFGVLHYAHRLAWFYTTGEWPEQDIDHVNGDPGDNRIINLRPATRRQNMANRKTSCRNKLGIKGVSQYRWGFRAHIRENGKMKALGTYKTAQEAQEVYLRRARELHGDFATVR